MVNGMSLHCDDITIPSGLKITLHKLLVLLNFKEILNKQSSFARIKTIEERNKIECYLYTCLNKYEFIN